MVNPYSHLVLASRLEDFVKPSDSAEYYWGSIAPDIRYLADIQRQVTHLPPEHVSGLLSANPHLGSFLQGYLVHCLCDEIDLSGVYCRHLPFSLLKKRFSRQHYAVILELYCFEKENIVSSISGTHNEVLESMGITPFQAENFGESLRRYQSVEAAGSRLQELFIFMGLQGDPRVEKYLKAAQSIQENRGLKQLLFLGIQTGKIIEELSAMVRKDPCWLKI